MFWQRGEFGVSWSCSELPASIKGSGMQGFCNQLLHQENSLNSLILPSPPPRCWLSQLEVCRGVGGVFHLPPPRQCLWQERCSLASVPNIPRNVLVLWEDMNRTRKPKPDWGVRWGHEYIGQHLPTPPSPTPPQGAQSPAPPLTCCNTGQVAQPL